MISQYEQIQSLNLDLEKGLSNFAILKQKLVSLMGEQEPRTPIDSARPSKTDFKVDGRPEGGVEGSGQNELILGIIDDVEDLETFIRLRCYELEDCLEEIDDLKENKVQDFKKVENQLKAKIDDLQAENDDMIIPEPLTDSILLAGRSRRATGESEVKKLEDMVLEYSGRYEKVVDEKNQLRNSVTLQNSQIEELKQEVNEMTQKIMILMKPPTPKRTSKFGDKRVKNKSRDHSRGVLESGGGSKVQKTRQMYRRLRTLNRSRGSKKGGFGASSETPSVAGRSTSFSDINQRQRNGVETKSNATNKYKKIGEFSYIELSRLLRKSQAKCRKLEGELATLKESLNTEIPRDELKKVENAENAENHHFRLNPTAWASPKKVPTINIFRPSHGGNMASVDEFVQNSGRNGNLRALDSVMDFSPDKVSISHQEVFQWSSDSEGEGGKLLNRYPSFSRPENPKNGKIGSNQYLGKNDQNPATSRPNRENEVQKIHLDGLQHESCPVSHLDGESQGLDLEDELAQTRTFMLKNRHKRHSRGPSEATPESPAFAKIGVRRLKTACENKENKLPNLDKRGPGRARTIIDHSPGSEGLFEGSFQGGYSEVDGGEFSWREVPKTLGNTPVMRKKGDFHIKVLKIGEDGVGSGEELDPTFRDTSQDEKAKNGALEVDGADFDADRDELVQESRKAGNVGNLKGGVKEGEIVEGAGVQGHKGAQEGDDDEESGFVALFLTYGIYYFFFLFYQILSNSF